MLEIYTDGSSRYDQVEKKWIGSYAFILVYKGKVIYQYATRISPATISECELIAVIHALHYAKTHYGEDIILYSDSQYVVNGLNRINTNKKHLELWNKAHHIARGVTIRKVKAHDKSVENNHVDALSYKKLKKHFS